VRLSSFFALSDRYALVLEALLGTILPEELLDVHIRKEITLVSLSM
jgi:hypothetical protein